MGVITKRVRKSNSAKRILNELYSNQENILVVHYSCESFYNIKDGRTPRITSIAFRYLNSGQTESFSIHKVAEKTGVAFDQITENYDSLEKSMLKEYFKFLQEHKSFKFIHWNMRNVNYGFQAIEHRYEVLGSKPYKIEDSKKFDLARIIQSRYSAKYATHPRLPNLMNANKMSKKNFLLGSEEAEAFDNKEYVKLHQSTLRKVDVFDDILKRSAEGLLKTNSNWNDIYGISPQGIFELTKENWIAGVAYALLWVIVGIILRNYLII